MSRHEFVCTDCGKKKVHVNPTGCGGVGYAVVDDDKKKVCYECCSKRDRAEMKAEGRIVLYLTKGTDGWIVTNWPGTLTFRVRERRAGRHNIADVREDVWFIGPDGHDWWGVNYGHNSQICRCRRLKVA